MYPKYEEQLSFWTSHFDDVLRSLWLQSLCPPIVRLTATVVWGREQGVV